MDLLYAVPLDLVEKGWWALAWGIEKAEAVCPHVHTHWPSEVGDFEFLRLTDCIPHVT